MLPDVISAMAHVMIDILGAVRVTEKAPGAWNPAVCTTDVNRQDHVGRLASCGVLARPPQSDFGDGNALMAHLYKP
jgi:hypothetical protein